MAIPLALFYYLYLLAVAVFLFFSAFAVYRLLKLSSFDLVSTTVTLLYIAITAMILLLAWNYISQINWQENLSVVPQLGLPEKPSL